MCEFCVRHGDGKRWYLNAANYAEELLADARRQKYIEDFIPEVSANAVRWLRLLDRAGRLSPGLVGKIGPAQSRRMKRIHFGQVIPIEDVEAVMGIAGQVVRLPCVCREVLQKREMAVCYLLAASPAKIGLTEILGRRAEAEPYLVGMERIEPAAASAEMAALEESGMIHTVWTFITPFIGAICNCEPVGCLALNFTARGLSLYFPGEETAAVDPARCTGCAECFSRCLFAAISLEGGRAVVDPVKCRGCGICRRACPREALFLEERASASI